MRRQFSIEPKKEYTFVVGQSDNYLIMRDLSANITLESDAFKHMVLSRSDTVVITEYQNVELRLVNYSDQTVNGEIQLSELDIRIREQKMGVDGSVIVDEILRPITVSEIQQPVEMKQSSIYFSSSDPEMWTTGCNEYFSAMLISDDEECVGEVEFTLVNPVDIVRVKLKSNQMIEYPRGVGDISKVRWYIVDKAKYPDARMFVVSRHIPSNENRMLKHGFK
ncbi:hypothetical protein ACB087_04145 [Vibrio sp. VNB-15]